MMCETSVWFELNVGISLGIYVLFIYVTYGDTSSQHWQSGFVPVYVLFIKQITRLKWKTVVLAKIEKTDFVPIHKFFLAKECFMTIQVWQFV